MRKLATKIALAIFGLAAMAVSANAACEPEKAAEKYPSLADRPVKVATTPLYAPYSYTENDKMVGSDIEISERALDCVGLKYEYTKGAWPSLLPTVLNGQTDVMVANLYYNEERAKQVDFIVYMKAGSALLVVAGNPHNVKSMDDLCGLETSVVSGSSSQPVIEDQSKKCEAAGKPAVDILVAPETDAAVRGLENGRLDFLLDNVGAAAVRVKDSPDKFAIAFVTTEEKFVGNAVLKGNKELAQAYLDGMKEIHANGVVGEIFRKYGLDEKLIIAPEIKQ
jgi:polar amino acid transport system substrate-binding protein